MQLNKGLVQSFFEMAHVPFSVYKGTQLLYTAPQDFFLPNLALLFDAGKLNHPARANMVLTKDFLLTGHIREISTGLVLVIGPILQHECTVATAKHILRSLKLPMERSEELAAFFKENRFYSAVQLEKILTLLDHVINDSMSETQDTALNDVGSRVQSINAANFDEAKLVSLIELGRPDEIKQAMNMSNLPETMIKARMPVYLFRKIFITGAVLASRAAVRAGIDYELSLGIADEFMIEMEAMEDGNEILKLLQEMLSHFAAIVKSRKRLQPSSIFTRAVSDYVLQHLYEKITIPGIAATIKLNASYLCQKFKKETGTTLVQYIQTCKVEEAKYLFRTTSLSVEDVAEKLQFSSYNYFMKVFRQIEGVTPVTYCKSKS